MPEAIYTIRLDNNRELDVQSSSIDEAAARALQTYPDATVIGWKIKELVEIEEETEGEEPE